MSDPLNKHLTDLVLNERSKKSDIICLTERQLTPNSYIQEFAALHGFEVAYSNNRDRFQSIAVCTAVDMCTISHTKLNDTSFVTILKSSCDNKCIKLLLLCEKHALPLSSFCVWLQGY